AHLRRLNYRDSAAHREPAGDRLAGRPPRGDRDKVKSRGRGGEDGALAAVGHGDDRDRRARCRRADATGDPRGGLGGGQAALELVWCNDNVLDETCHGRRLATAVGASARRTASSSNSFTASMSLPMDTLVIRSRITSTTTGTRCSIASFCASPRAGPMPSGSKTRSALQPRPSATLTWSTP